MGHVKGQYQRHIYRNVQMTHQQEIADRLAQLRREKSARERRDVLQREIAKAAGLSVVTYGRYESGQRKVPDEVVISLAGYYGTTPWFIRYGVEAGERAVATSEAALPPQGLHGEPRSADVKEVRKRNQAKRNAAKKAAAGDQPGPTRRPRLR
jgi:transcriptional regulator with XRE-family HTH domain